MKLECNNEIYKIKLSSIKKVNRRNIYIPEYCKGKNVLTIGCVDMIEVFDLDDRIASGSHQLHNLSLTCKSVVGVDINKEGIKKLREKGFEIYEYDILSDDENPVGNIEFDVLIISHVIEHIPNCFRFLRSIVNKFKFKEIIVAVPNAYHFDRIYEILDGHIENISNDHYYTFSSFSLIKLMESVGLETINLFQDTMINTRKLNMYYDEGDLIYIGKLKK